MRTSLHNLSKIPNTVFISFLTICFLLFGFSSSKAQVVFTVNDNEGAQNVAVDITVENFDDIVSTQFSVNWDPAYLGIDSVGNFGLPSLSLGNFSTDSTSGYMILAWVDPLVVGNTLADGSILFTLYFDVLQEGPSDICITNDPVIIEITDISISVIPHIVNCGEVIGAGTTVSGNVYHDLNDDCAFQNGEAGLENWILKFSSDQNFYASTDENGNYSIFIDTGDYVVELILPNGFWGACDNYVNIDLDGTIDPYELDFPVRSIIDCPLMSVDVSTPFLRRCLTNTYHVDYCNVGSADAVDPYVEIEFDEYLEVTNSSVNYSMIAEGIYSFDIGSLLVVGDCGSFTVEATLDCDSTIIGQTHCVMAHAYPDSLCTPPPINWSGASLQINGTCTGSEVQFVIENIGDDMTQESQYIVIEDAVMYAPNDFIIPAGGTMPVSLPANGSTYRFEVGQAEGHPGYSMPSLTIEGCGTNDDGEFSIGFVTQFSENDNDPWISIDCHESIGSYDPNDKIVYPKGYGDEHFIKPNIDIEYKIRFQNTGTDTAFSVVVEDTLSTFLDPATIRPGVSSHPYDFELTEQGLLRFSFNNIMLPDSNVNEVASHGFVKFKMAQKPDLPNGTIINNEAAIYFDFNEAVWTNQTFHEVQREFVIVNTQQVFVDDVKVMVYPNPFSETATFEIDGKSYDELNLRVYDSVGRLVSNQIFNSQPFEFSRKGLLQSLYFYELRSEGILISTGKLLMY